MKWLPLFVTSSWILLAASGCQKVTHEDHDDGGGGHHHEAPRGGALVVLGDEFAHIEFVLEESSGTLTAYVLDGHCENPIRLEQESFEVTVTEPAVTLTMTVVESPLTGETAGDSSQFVATDPVLKQRTEFAARIKTVEVRGSEFNAVDFRYPEGNEDH